MAIQIEACQEPDPNDPQKLCGASLAAAGRCLAHLAPDARDTYLTTLSPGDKIHARGVRFTRDLLNSLLEALEDEQGRRPIGAVDFSGANFTEGANFSVVIFTETAHFAGATFADEASFHATTFAKAVSFDRARFAKSADFGDATFSGSISFIRTTFAADTSFDNATFGAGAIFREAEFIKGAGFSTATFTEDAFFDEVAFTQDIWFSGATFMRNAYFRKTNFGKSAIFLHCTFTANAVFDQAIFAQRGDFTQTTFLLAVTFGETVVSGELLIVAAARRLTAVGLKGQGRMSLRLRATQVDLTDVVLAGALTVHGMPDPIYATDESGFGDATTGRVPPVRIISLQRVDAALVTLTDVDLSDCRFTGLHRADQLVLDGRCLFASSPKDRRRVLAEEHHWRARETKRAERRLRTGVADWTPAPEYVHVVEPPRIEVLYRQLRKALEDGKNEPGAADFYYGEMEMRRAASQRWPERMLLWLYWVLSGYGLRARRALGWLALVAVLSIAGTTWFGFPEIAQYQKATGTVVTSSGQQPIDFTIHQADPVRPVSRRMEKATEITLNAVVFRNPDTDLTTAGRYLNILIRILGPTLLGLSVLAIRNQVKR